MKAAIISIFYINKKKSNNYVEKVMLIVMTPQKPLQFPLAPWSILTTFNSFFCFITAPNFTVLVHNFHQA